MARLRPPHVRSVQTPEALAALRSWLEAFPSSARERGGALVAQRRVEKVWAAADHYVEAKVAGEEPQSVTLFLTLGKWSSRCSCDGRTHCPHTFAAGASWIAEVGRAPAGAPGDGRAVEPAPSAPVAVEPANPPDPALTKSEFQEKWSRVLAKKLHRELTPA
jgi:hypothetical protein